MYSQNGFTTLKNRSTDGEKPKHFWALAVWDCQAEVIKVWEITQVQIRGQITELAQSEDWGDPSGYDIKIKRVGIGTETKYTVIPVPPLGSPLSEALARLKEVDLTQLFSGDDPFAIEDIPL